MTHVNNDVNNDDDDGGGYATTNNNNNKDDAAIQEALDSSAQDLGHRLGNFHNYYRFHPPSNRLEHMGEILTHIRDTSSRKRHCSSIFSSANTTEQQEEGGNVRLAVFTYCDLGCNEGDLTIEISKALRETLKQPIEFTGMDIDAELIQRAHDKWKKDNDDDLSGRFVSGNICTDLDQILDDGSMDLISLLSTTMWVHVHAGDEGLKKLLEQLCIKSRRYLLIEPQPSKCYRNAMIRLRKMKRPELDVSNERLQWRPKLDDEIEATLNNCSFYRITEGQDRTSWNRSIHLYEKR